MSPQNRHSELTFQLMVESAPGAMLLVNDEGKIDFINTQTEHLFGYERNELIGKSIEFLIPGRFIPNHPTYTKEFFNSPEARPMGIGKDLFALKKDGTEFPVEIGLNPIETTEGRMVFASIIDITERKKYYESQALYASIVNSCDDAVISKTLDGIITSWNKGAEKLFGYNKDEIIGKNVSILIPPERINEEPEIINQISKGELVDHYETQRMRKDGTLVFISISVSPIRDSNGKIVGASKIARDISDRIEAEEQLERNEKRFRALLENNNDAITLHDANGVVFYQSPAVERITGYSIEDTKGKSALDLFHLDYIQASKDRIKEALENPGKSIYGINRIRHKDGHYVWTEGTTTNLLEDENVKAMVGNFRDITDRKTAEEEIEKSEKKFRALIENNNEAIMLLDAHGVVFYQSPSVERMTGFSMNDSKGKIAIELFRPELTGSSNERIKEALQNPGKPIYGINKLRHGGGHYVWVEITLTNLLEDENVNGLVANFRDITERKIAEEKILKANRLYAFLSGINQAIVHTRDEKLLFDEVCRVSTEIGLFEMAWIGLVNEKEKGISLVAESNATPRDLELLSHPKYDANGPTATALKTGVYYLNNDVENLSSTAAWINYIKDRKLKSMIVLPIKRFGKTIGTFNIYSSIANFFDDKEIELLVEASGDISFALGVFAKEKQIAQSETRLKGAQQMAHLGDWEYDMINHEVSWSDENYRIYGLEPGSVSPSSGLMLSFVHPDDIERIQDEVKNAMTNFTSFENIRRIVRSNGEIRYIYATSIFDFDKSNKPIRLHGTTLDVTEITQKEEELRNSELRFREFFDGAPEAIVILDVTTGTVVMANNSTKKMLGFSAEDIIGKTPQDFSADFQPDGVSSIEKTGKYIGEAMNGEMPVFEWVARKATGEEFMAEVRVVKLSQIDQNSIMASFVDITERKNSELLKEKMTADLLQRNKDLEQFTYIVSHNLRGPVANIIGLSDLLQRPEFHGDSLGIMVSNLAISVSRLDDVIKDLNYILQVRREVSEKNEPVKFSKIVEDIKLSIANLIKNEKAKITYHFEVDEFFTLKSYLYSVFYNLVSNSIKYRQPGVDPVIEIKSEKIKNKIVITFKDNGLGIDLEKKGSQVFGLYKRFHLHTEGKGMGLFMTKTQVETMGGSITIKSKVNEGTEFRIIFETGN